MTQPAPAPAAGAENSGGNHRSFEEVSTCCICCVAPRQVRRQGYGWATVVVSNASFVPLFYP
jgi:hypothetical protein